MTSTIPLETDVLVIGGGVAGARAAYDANRAGLSVTMVIKGLLGKSGCSIFAGNLNYFAPPRDEEGAPPPDAASENAELRIRRTMAFLAKYTHYLGDQEYMRNASQWSQREFFDWIESRGIYILRDADGGIVTDLPRRTQAWAVQMGMSGTVVMDMLRKLIFDTGIRVLEQTTATCLMTRDGEVIGATALDFVNGRFFAIRAKTVILATGHSNYMSLRSTGTRDGSASGWVLAYDAGAKIQNIEMQWHHASDVAYPATWMRLHLYPNPLPGTEHRSQLFNGNGEMFFDGDWLPDNPVPYIMQLKHLAGEIDAGRARLDGGYYSNFRHVERHSLDHYIYQTQFARKIGIDLSEEMFENAVTWHMNVGGVRVNGLTMESDVQGLLAAGSVTALVTGGLANSMFEGLTAAETARRRVETRDRLDEPDAAQPRRRGTACVRIVADGAGAWTAARTGQEADPPRDVGTHELHQDGSLDDGRKGRTRPHRGRRSAAHVHEDRHAQLQLRLGGCPRRGRHGKSVADAGAILALSQGKPRLLLSAGPSRDRQPKLAEASGGAARRGRRAQA